MASNVEKPSGVEEEDSLSMLDVLQEEKELEDDADAILGGSDSGQCTYSEGYMQRQALYACATCIKEDMEPAGVCLACSLECHEGHTLFELYTKRNFRCDCGNKKFGDKKCKLNPDKAQENEKNRYSQNFRGLYCTCHRPYPDLDDSIEDEMIQCNLCEDWFHSRHLGGELPEVDYEEMICDGCLLKNNFLYAYTQLFPQLYRSTITVVEKTQTAEPVSVTSEAINNAEQSQVSTSAADKSQSSESVNAESPSKAAESTVVTPVNEAKPVNATLSNDKSGEEKGMGLSCANPSTVGNSPTQYKGDQGCTSSSDIQTDKIPSDKTEEAACSSQTCKLELLQQNGSGQISKGATFWPESWRMKLCTCPRCQSMYKELGVSFLCDMNDTLRVYTDKGKVRKSSQYEKGMQALQNMDRVKQVEVLTEFNTMKNALTDYLKKFAENKKTVRKEDIEAFYENLRAKKRPRLEMSYFCR